MMGLFADGRRLLGTGGWESWRDRFSALLLQPLQHGAFLTEEPSFPFGAKQCLLSACTALFN